MPADIPRAAAHWELGSRRGHVLASYNLAMLHLGNHTSARRPCEAGVALLKRVAERGWPTEQEAHEDWLRGDAEWALLNYLKAAEMGYGDSALNAAWLLRKRGADESASLALALALLRRASAQGSTAARRELGDAAWYGRGAPRDAAAAARRYAEAGAQRDAQSLFNLALLHAVGAGVPRDTRLARRYLERARSARPREAGVAVALALGALRLGEIWEQSVAPRLPAAWAYAVQGVATGWARPHVGKEIDGGSLTEGSVPYPNKLEEPVRASYEESPHNDDEDDMSEQASEPSVSGSPSLARPPPRAALSWLQAADAAIMSITIVQWGILMVIALFLVILYFLFDALWIFLRARQL